ncbi:MAG: RNA polymerase sigma factor RpoH [Betaproteobacteria bacterium]|jgi:RNA polymerase sigma-32 factor|nr:RNA polymerase sigma factor RpoH [Rhodocyclaceae bacterium]MCA3135895.1 RNA polymerase sigma factor RpoH [Rhodocyclaceae bacterium]MCA3140822.1 RNA polymerase sigma factor RpoH [Rhodocyclaceae bacterium]MCA3146001.1 RNA polymerase sigma factor RpoH [Rhodocyclaceae bacterium]MCE2899324.1 RNA polymerase sigma factor RpoH [Betaproteobacteria bacterium]
MATALVPFTGIASASSLDSYISAVNHVPLLTQEEETRLARQFRDQDDLLAAHQLVLSHLRLVVAIARGYLGYGLPQADLIQEGNIGLMKAVKRFDPERGVRLVSFAVHWIRAEIHEHILRNWRIVKIATTKAQRKLFFNLRSMKQGLNTLTSTEVESVASQLRVKPEEVVEMETRLGGQDVALESSSEDEDESFSPIAYLTNAEDEPARILEQAEQESRRSGGLAQALAGLDARSRRIIEARWLREEGQSATLHELADEFGVSAERIRQIEAQAMKKMRTAMN